MSLIKYVSVISMWFLAVVCEGTRVERAFDRDQVTPDVVPIPPSGFLIVEYGENTYADLGNVLPTSATQSTPEVSWHPTPGAYYTLAMVDPDVPSRVVHYNRAIVHWLIVNIKGSDVCTGEVLAEYIGPAPPAGSGLHRYTLVVYQQQSKMVFNETRITKSSPITKRVKFSISKFATKHQLGNPISGNFFQSQLL